MSVAPATRAGATPRSEAGKDGLRAPEGSAERLNQTPPARPWVVLAVRDRGARHHERYVVSGFNHHYTPPRSFFWHVPALDERYDMTQATVIA